MKLFVFLILLVCIVSDVSAIICYYGETSSSIPMILDTNTISGICGNETCMCSSYKYACSTNDTSCTIQEQQAQMQKWAWIVTGQTACQEMMMAPTVYVSLTCCDTDYCNKQTINKAGYYQI
jgi:hypothetical protein